MKVVDFNQIKNLGLSAQEMFDWTCEVWQKQDDFILPAKTKMWQGESGRYITMPCCLPDLDIAGVKFISRNVDDVNGLPARNSNIMLQRISEHGLYAILDGTYITTMRTGACAYYNAVKFSKANPKAIAIYGLGLAARAFMFFWNELYKKPITVKLLRYKRQAEEFIEKYKDNPHLTFEIYDQLEDCFDADIIVSCVSFARSEFCPAEVYQPGCTVIPVQTRGFQNCDLAFPKVIIDDVEHVKSYKYYEQFKDKMIRITDAVRGIAKGRENDEERIIVYSGGVAITDMYWAMKVLEKIGNNCQEVPMCYPEERFWI